jgi:hypothetical protein
MSTERIVIAKQIYVGFSDREESNRVWENDQYVYHREQYVLGFATYNEDNAAFRKRQSTIHGWCRGLNNQPVSRAPEVFENTPQTGLRISRNVTHGGGWNDLTVFWRIVDPRGFELEITSGNLARLFQYCDIESGLIKGDCVYGFDKGNGSKVVLLPVKSEIYQDSIKSTEIHEAKSLKIKDIALGDVITLKNGTKGVYLGKQYLVHVSHADTDTKQSRWSDGTTDWAICSAQKHFICTIATPEYAIDDAIVVFATPNIINVEKTAHVLTEREAEIFANTKMSKDGKSTVTNLGTELFTKIVCSSFKLPHGTGKFVSVNINIDTLKTSWQKELDAHHRIIESRRCSYSRYNELFHKTTDPELADEFNNIECVVLKYDYHGAIREGTLQAIKMDGTRGMWYHQKPVSPMTWSLKITANPLESRSDTHIIFAIDKSRGYSNYARRAETEFDFSQVVGAEEVRVEFDNGEGPKVYGIRNKY